MFLIFFKKRISVFWSVKNKTMTIDGLKKFCRNAGLFLYRLIN